MQNELTYNACKQLFEQNKLSISEDAYIKLDQYAKLLQIESAHQNVTAVHEAAEIWSRHFLDSAYLLQYITADKVLDLGTGGGIPAIPLAIMNQDLAVTMLDSELKKIEFCRSAVQSLGISANPINGRAEELARAPEYENKFDVVVSRAMANGSVLTELAARFLHIGGILLAMKGKQYDPSVERFAEAAAAVGCKVENEITYELDSETKNLIILRKIADTPAQYPRRYAKIKRCPL